MRDHNQDRTVALREQAEFLRREREAKDARIRKVAADNPDLSSEALCERFGETLETLARLLSPADMKRRREDSILKRSDCRKAVDGGVYLGCGRRRRAA